MDFVLIEQRGAHDPDRPVLDGLVVVLSEERHANNLVVESGRNLVLRLSSGQCRFCTKCQPLRP